MKEGYVLYVDHAKHPAPLSMCYHATGARRLSSAVDRHPPATLTEVDSAFCPQCLSYHDAASAARMGFCPKPSCARCPLCQGVCAIASEKSLFFYKCVGACDWTSKECNIVVEIEEEGQALGRLEFARLLEDLGTALKRRRASDEEWQEPWKTLSKAWAQRMQESKGNGSHRNTRLSRNALEGWSVETLEASIKERQRALLADEDFASKLQLPVHRISLDDDPVQTQDSLNGVSHTTIQLQALNRPNQITARSELLPLPIPLRPRLSRRCRAELAQGRPGILLKPKLNPLEGDSSLRSGHGQWFKKDSSAILVMPRVRMINFDVSAERSAFLLKVTNPTLGPVRLRFAASAYKGELGWDTNDPPETHINHLLVDELTQTLLDIKLDTNVLRDLATTETVELLSSEDSFIEFGGKARETPPEIREWTAPEDVVDKSAIRLVASSSSTAWFELLTFGLESTDGQYPAIPIALEVEVGNGSWESSLIPQQQNENDFVSFDLVIAAP